MPATRSRHARRQDAPLFDPKTFYTFNNPTLRNAALSSGIFLNNNGVVNMTQAGAYSSENWQIFFQSGVYFIRNYDYGAKMQLGVTEENRNTPKLYPGSGNISQQWTISKVDGGYELINGLTGPETYLVLPSLWPGPALRSDKEGSVWNITSNPSAAESKPLSGDWTKSIADFQVVSATPSSMPSPTSIRAVIPTPTNDIPQSSGSGISGSSPGSTTSSPSLPAGAIAGIAIGSVAALAAILFTLWFFCAKKRKMPKHDNPYEVHGTPPPREIEGTPTTEKYAYRAELAVPPAELADRENEGIKNRAELDSSSVEAPPKWV